MFCLGIYIYIYKKPQTLWYIRYAVRKLEMTTNQSCGLIEANFPTKDYEGALMGIHGQSQEQPKGFPPSQDMLTENKTAETCVVVIASFFTPFQKETTGDCSICQGLPVICELLAQLSRIGQSRRCPKDIKRSHIL